MVPRCHAQCAVEPSRTVKRGLPCWWALTGGGLLQGDWGTQFGMLITNMEEKGGLDRVGDNSISDLLKLYRYLPCAPFSSSCSLLIIPALPIALLEVGS